MSKLPMYAGVGALAGIVALGLGASALGAATFAALGLAVSPFVLKS